jgi:hypothetical protein
MIKVISWNIKRDGAPWNELLDKEVDADVALLQEAGKPPTDLKSPIEIGPVEHWDSHVWNSRWFKGRWGRNRLYDRWAMVVRLSDRVKVEWFKQISPISEQYNHDEIAVSGIGTIAAARVTPLDGKQEPFVVVSMYARWMRPHPSIKTKWRVGHADGSAHRIVSDLSAFIGDTNPSTHRILAAGDLNMVYGSLGESWQSLARRERTVFDRMEALGLEFMGPQHPAGERADTPADLPEDTRNVRTHRESQLDYVFASRGFHESVRARALNKPSQWKSSDHCRLLIEVGRGD